MPHFIFTPGECFTMKKSLLWGIVLLGYAFYPACSKPVATLQVEAGIVYAVGGVQPVAKEKVYLLIADPMKAGNDNGSVDGSLLYRQLTSPGSQGKMDNREFALSFLKTAKVWSPLIRATSTTDFQGKASFPPLAPATYWILFIAPTRSGVAMWSLPITLELGENRILLSQDNALFAE